MNQLLDMLLHGWAYSGVYKEWDDGVVEVKVQHRVPYGEWIEL